MNKQVLIDENGNLYVSVRMGNKLVVWNAHEKYLGFVPLKTAAKLLKNLGAL